MDALDELRLLEVARRHLANNSPTTIGPKRYLKLQLIVQQAEGRIAAAKLRNARAGTRQELGDAMASANRKPKK
jgi:hypothetical protein